MASHWTRRAALIGGLSAAGSAAIGAPPLVSLRPTARPTVGSGVRPLSRPDIADLIARSELGGQVGFVVRDVATGALLANEQGDLDLPPASVTKSVTALYALTALGPAYRFETKIYARGPVIDGVLEGDLILAGGGAPRLSTGDLMDLRTQLLESGITKVRGRFFVWSGTIDRIAEIDPGQLDHLGYNPSVSGLNLNFNRVHFEWERQGKGFRIQMDARGRDEEPLVDMAKMQVVDRNSPVFDYVDGNGVDLWSVSSGALRRDGSRWLPVRYPALYTGDVFQALAASKGLILPEPEHLTDTPQGEVVARHQGRPLADIMRLMLKNSTNLTAEVAGLSATARLSGAKRGLRTSAFQMAQWVRQQTGARAHFEDHSGLSDGSRISAASMAELLSASGVHDSLYPILKPIQFLDNRGNIIPNFPAEGRAKTGTLNFVTTLAGYLKINNGRTLAFSYFAADLERREVGKLSGDEQPSGAASYNTKARQLQHRLLKHVVKLATA